MPDENEYGTYGFRFTESTELPLCGLFAVGRERERSPKYRWDGLERDDGPLLLFQYTLEGEGAVELAGRRVAIGPGRAFLVDIPGDHRYYLPEDSAEWSFLFLLFRPHVVAPIWNELRAKLGETPYLPVGSAPIRELRRLFEDARDGRITDPYAASAGVYRFVMELARFAASPGRGEEDWPPAVREAVRHIDAHYADMVGQEQLATIAGLSKYHLLRTFARCVGMTPNDYLNRVRIERSVELLGRTDWNLERIAAAVGYSSASYYIKVFRKWTGVTPSQFRAGERLPYNRLYFDR